MGRWLLGFSVLSAALLATTFAHQETKRSTARDAWRMEDNQEERRKEVKGDNPSNENQENSVMRKVSRREGIFSTRYDEPIRKVDSKRTESVSSRREGNEPTRKIDSRRRESVSSRREGDEPTRRVDSGRTESVSSRREGDEPTRRVDSRRTKSVSSRREGNEPTRMVGSRRT